MHLQAFGIHHKTSKSSGRVAIRYTHFFCESDTSVKRRRPFPLSGWHVCAAAGLQHLEVPALTHLHARTEARDESDGPEELQGKRVSGGISSMRVPIFECMQMYHLR